jgi:hypothetical protein
MVRVIRNEQEAYRLKNGSSRAGEINRTYMDLVTGLGVPTFDEESGDGKVQVEWVCVFKRNVFTIYDWKTYDREFTEWDLQQFHIGSKSARGYEVAEFVDAVRKLIADSYEKIDNDIARTG